MNIQFFLVDFIQFLYFLNCYFWSYDVLNHASQQVVDVLFTVSKVTTLCEMVGLLLPSAIWIVELEWPEEVGHLLEIWTNGGNFVDDVFNANDAEFAF